MVPVAAPFGHGAEEGFLHVVCARARFYLEVFEAFWTTEHRVNWEESDH